MLGKERLKGDFPEPLTYIAGYAGTGKSTLLPYLLDATGFDPQRIFFVAPTGKAAKVMRKKLALQNYPNTNATTIHSAIYRGRPAPVNQLEEELDKAKEAIAECAMEGIPGDSEQVRQLMRKVKNLEADLMNLYVADEFHFQLNVESPIAKAQCIVVDEASMVGMDMTQDLLSFGVPILALGDPGQLPPVKDKPGLTANKPDFFLSEIHRQAAGNPIIRLATLAREGKDLPYGEYHDEQGVLRATVGRRREYDPEPLIEAVRNSIHQGTEDPNLPQIIVGTNKTRYRVTKWFREGLPMGPVANEPLIVRKNVREHPNLVNGTLAKCLSQSVNLYQGDVTCQMSFMDEDGATYADMTVYQGLFEDHHAGKKNSFTSDGKSAYRAKQRAVQLDFAHALTVHNVQGSQFDHVVLIDESASFREDANKHLYTGVTRAAETLTVLI